MTHTMAVAGSSSRRSSREDRNRYYDLKEKRYLDEYKWEGEEVPRIYDFHRTVNLFTSDEWNDLIKDVKYPIILLSYVGFGGETRVKVEGEMPHYHADNYFLCFVKKGDAREGTKGYFMSKLVKDPSTLTLVDDRIKNCNSAIAAGCQTIQVFSKSDVVKSLSTLA